jgi:hypothetical protein
METNYLSACKHNNRQISSLRSMSWAHLLSYLVKLYVDLQLEVSTARRVQSMPKLLQANLQLPGETHGLGLSA